MVLRSSDAARDLPGRTAENSAQLDELARAQSRGAQALRNDAGHILELNPASPNPLITPQGTDAALRFQDGMLTVTDGDGEYTRDLTVRSMKTEQLLVTNNAIKCIPYDGAVRFSYLDGALEVANRDGTEFRGIRCSRVLSNDIDSNGDINASGGIRAEAGLSCGGTFAVGVRARSPNWSSSVYDGALRWNPNGAGEFVNYAGSEYRGVYATNFAPPPSWRAYKRDLQTVTERLGESGRDVVDGLDVRFHRYDRNTAPAGYDCDEVRLGPMLDELPAEFHEQRVGRDGEDASSYDLTKVLGLALAAIQDVSADLRECRAENADLRRRLDEAGL